MKRFDPTMTAKQIAAGLRLRPKLAIVLGSGFRHALAGLKVERKISYAKLSGFPKPGVKGHAGELFVGTLGGTPVLVLSGRSHFYEGHPMETVTFPMRVLAAFGIRDVLLTNAAGGIHRKFRAGDFMVVTDHINFMGTNPLRGSSHFVDMSEVYDPKLAALLQKAGQLSRTKLRAGVYVAVSGPSYETPAEIRAFESWGADAVGMSTVPEAIVARACGLGVAGLSNITNLAAGLGRDKVSHEEVLQTGERVGALAAQLLQNFAKLYGQKH